uniref:Secreted protein n=1 Tax=Globodera rostochiensis TaxID=31243 RepID=A0A914I8X2_GLORO
MSLLLLAGQALTGESKLFYWAGQALSGAGKPFYGTGRALSDSSWLGKPPPRSVVPFPGRSSHSRVGHALQGAGQVFTGTGKAFQRPNRTAGNP